MSRVQTLSSCAQGSANDPKRTSLPIECHAHHRPVLRDVESIFAKPAFFAEISGERAVADNERPHGET